LINASTAPTLIPINLSGIDISQTMGHKINASTAMGQQMMNRMSQARNLSMVMTAEQWQLVSWQ
jgi:hypothetical protein